MSNATRKQFRFNAFVLALAGSAGLGIVSVAAAQSDRAAPPIQAVNDDTLADAGTYARFIVKFREDGSAKAVRSEAARFAAIDAVANGAGLKLNHVRRLAIGAELIEVDGKALDRAKAANLMARFARAGNVEYVEPDARMQASYTPNDTYYPQQWHLGNGTGGMRLPAAWARATGIGVLVAVLDTGIVAHSDLSGNVMPGFDFISDPVEARDGDGRDSDPNDEGDWRSATDCEGSPARNSSWHGTHVAGTIAAVTGNGTGVAGVAYGAYIQPLRVLGRCGGVTSDIADAIVWASGGAVPGVRPNPQQARLINMSLGGVGPCSSTYQYAINYAVSRGVAVVTAAGNANDDASRYQPASCANVINVAALGPTGGRAAYSNYGAVVDVAAPGGDLRLGPTAGVLSTLNTGTTTPGQQAYAYYQGTSMAAPHITGLAALIVQHMRAAPPWAVEWFLKRNARPIPGGGCGSATPCGTGLADATATINDVIANANGFPPLLANGVAKQGLYGATTSEQLVALAVPRNALNVRFALAGGTGNADLYVNFGVPPTTGIFACSSRLPGNIESCTFATGRAGTYYAVVRGGSTYAGVTLTGSYNEPLFRNQNNYAVNDFTTTGSPVVVSGLAGDVPNNLLVKVRIVHSFIGDLKVELVSPHGTVYAVLHDRTGLGTDNIDTTYVVNGAAIPANGTWTLRVTDFAYGDTGYLDDWSLRF